MDLKTRRKLKDIGLKPVLSNQGEYYNCNDVTNFFKEIIEENRKLSVFVECAPCKCHWNFLRTKFIICCRCRLLEELSSNKQ